MRCAPLTVATLAGALLAGTALPGTALADPPQVVVSIKPLHSLAAAVMEGVGEPTLLIEGAASPHDYSLRPSDARALQEADLVLWAGPSVEGFLEDALEGLVDEAKVIEAQDLEGMLLLPPREGGIWEAHEHHRGEAHGHEEGDDHGDDDEADHDHDHEDHDHAHEHGHEHGHDHGHDHGDEVDGHIWLDPANGRVVLAALATTLSALDPENADRYRANAAEAEAGLAALDAELLAALAPVAERPYIVFHDAYQYFERHYGLAAAGSITVSPDQQPGARRLQDIRERLERSEAVCVFAEPQFEPALVATLIEGTGVRSGTLDPLGATLEAGPDAYAELLRGLASDLVACLGEG